MAHDSNAVESTNVLSEPATKEMQEISLALYNPFRRHTHNPIVRLQVLILGIPLYCATLCVVRITTAERRATKSAEYPQVFRLADALGLLDDSVFCDKLWQLVFPSSALITSFSNARSQICSRKL